VAGIDRVCVFRVRNTTGKSQFGQVYLWHEQTISQKEEFIVFPETSPINRWFDVVSKGGYIHGHILDMAEDEAAFLSSHGAKSVYFVPIFTRGQFWGAVALEDHNKCRYFDEDCLDLLQSAAHLCASTILRASTERESKKASKKAYYDGLTNIYNRRYFDENITRVTQSLSRSDSTLSLMMIDIDYFKPYNDTYGHSAGDECLKIIADILSKNIPRADDFVARYGGEEFVVVLPNTDEKGARFIAEKILNLVQDCKIPHKENTASDYITISIGVTSGKVSHMQSGNDFIDLADKMLYEAKRNGRNRYIYRSF
jgi:diguanylate cyclase (GGDEF)-like protein